VFGINPVGKDAFLGEEKRVVTLLCEEEFQALLDACDVVDGRIRKRGPAKRPPLRDFILFLRYTGCRVGEALHLRVEDVNRMLDEFSFRSTKNGEDRTLPLLPHIADILDKQDAGNGYWFVGEAVRNGLRIAFQKARASAGLDNLHMHDLRHMASSWMQHQGVDFISSEFLLGHKVRGMLGYYAHAYPKGVVEALEKLGNPFLKRLGRVTNGWQEADTGTEPQTERLLIHGDDGRL